MAKSKGPSMASMPSKAQMAKDDRHYRAESMVRDAMQNTAQFKQAVRQAERELAKADTAIKGALKKGKA